MFDVYDMYDMHNMRSIINISTTMSINHKSKHCYGLPSTPFPKLY